ncbi:MAG: histidine kinase N-terminal 7TM domain-containing protein, partial [Anaerolineales bacterium]|nr:histidine kinase N-terminal 7TM domain-containing protein [Anaerolineales bacterium]
MFIFTSTKLVALALNSCFLIGLAILIWPRRTAPGAYALIGLLLGVSHWSGLTIFEALAVGIPAKIFWVVAEYPGVMATPVFFTLFAIDYTRQSEWIPHRYRFLLWIIPVITLVIASTNQYHGWMWSRVTLAENNGMFFEYGVWYWVMTFYIYCLLIIGVAALFRAMIRNPKFFRRQIIFLLFSFLIPVIGKLIYMAGGVNAGLDLTPIYFSLTSAILTWNILHYNLFDILPLAHDTLFEIIPDGMLVIDQYDRIVDVNLILREWLNLQKNVIGKNAREVFKDYIHIIANFEETNLPHMEVQMGKRKLDVSVTRLRDSNGVDVGRLFSLRNVTERKKMEGKLRKTNEQLISRINEIQELQIQLREQAIRDPLTGLYNRRYLNETLDRELARAEREGSLISFIMIDIDHFKKVNDTLGHNVGDVVLKS